MRSIHMVDMVLFRCLIGAVILGVGSEAFHGPYRTTHASKSRASMSRMLHPPRVRLSLNPSIALSEYSARSTEALRPEDAWAATVDVYAFRQDMRALGKELLANQGADDVNHLRKMCLWSNLCAIVGVATMWMPPNPVTVMALSLWSFSRWAVIAHHTCHGGYDHTDATKFFHSSSFAVGSQWQRFRQWFDWMLPEAWNHEHNVLHHYRLGEVGDPDLVENNLEFVRSMTAPRAVKYAGVAFLMCTWKWFYYAPNTYKELMIREMRRRGEVLTADMEARKEFTLKYFAEPAWSRGTQYQWYTFAHFFKRVMGPYLVGRFVLLPLPLLLLGPAIAAGLSALSPLLSPHLTNWLLPSTAAASAASGAGLLFFQHAVWNLFLADVLTNIHSFVMIMPNHCGSDLYKFSTSCRPNSGTFYLRQVSSSANFKTGGDWNDFFHGWLNYGAEHHLFPNLSALSYRRAQPRVQALCEKHGVPYTQESVWRRLKKTVDVMCGDASMRPFPAQYEEPRDLMVWADERADAEAAAAAAVAAPSPQFERPQAACS